MRMYIGTFPRMQALRIGCALLAVLLSVAAIRPNRSNPQQRSAG